MSVQFSLVTSLCSWLP